MRFEAQIALWFGAGLAVSLVSLHAATTSANLAVWEESLRASLPPPQDHQRADPDGYQTEGSGQARAAIPSARRPLFKFVERPQSEPPPLEPAEVAPQGPVVVLKGIVSEGGSRLAVVTGGGNGESYVVVDVGDQIGGHRVVAVNQESVVVEAADGTESTMKLRGLGETP